MSEAVSRASSALQGAVRQRDPRRTDARPAPSRRASWTLIAASGLLFVAVLPLAHRFIGDDAIHLGIFPVAAAAVLQGTLLGLATAAATFGVEAAMTATGVVARDEGFADLLTASFTSVAISIALGRVHVLLAEVRAEAAARSDAERARADAERARADALEDLSRRDSYDALTGLPMHVQLERDLDAVLAMAKPEAMELAVVALNIAEFHEFNDTFGYGAGDTLLQQIPRRLARAATSPAVMGRIGGDEFCLGAYVPVGRGAMLGRHVLDALAVPFAIDGVRLAVTGSTGVAVARDRDTAASLLMRVNIALSAARSAGRTSVAYSDALARSSPERLALVADLQEAIEGDRIGVVFQPQVDPATGAFVGAEALARWTHPERGAIPPDDFVRLAERTGLIGGLTDRVLEAAIRAWGHGQDGARVAVNVSTLDLTDVTLPDRITRMLTRHGLRRDRFTIEVTESVLARDMRAVIPVLEAFRSRRIHVSVDDFGTGYSSLAYLHDLPVNELKMDRSFVRLAADEPRARTILRSTIALARDLGLRTVAEGVEDRRTYRLLADMGCSAAQGFFISPPRPADELREWIARR